jgi:phosphatidylserine synthase
MLIIGIIASIFFGIQGYIYPIIAGLLLQLWYILDHVDGEVARYRKQTSAKGLFIDLINHHIVHPLIFFFISLGLYNKFNDFRILLIGTFIMFSLLLQDLINLDKKEAKEVIEGNKTNLINKQNLSLKGRLFKKITQIFYKFPGIMNILFITAILDQLLLIFLFYGFSFPIMIFLKILHNLRTPKHKF